MVYNREGYAPWSLTRKAGVQSATIDGDISVPQYIQPVLDTGFVDEKGDWKGRKSSDEQFIAFQKDDGIANGGEILTPTGISGKPWPLDMTGFTDLQIAIKTTQAGNYAFEAIMGPDDFSYANLNPVSAAAPIRGNENLDSKGFDKVLSDSAEVMTADVWNILFIRNVLQNIKLLQFKITNNSGSAANIETAFLRLV